MAGARAGRQLAMASGKRVPPGAAGSHQSSRRWKRRRLAAVGRRSRAVDIGGYLCGKGSVGGWSRKQPGHAAM